MRTLFLRKTDVPAPCTKERNRRGYYVSGKANDRNDSVETALGNATKPNIVLRIYLLLAECGGFIMRDYFRSNCLFQALKHFFTKGFSVYRVTWDACTHDTFCWDCPNCAKNHRFHYVWYNSEIDEYQHFTWRKLVKVPKSSFLIHFIRFEGFIEGFYPESYDREMTVKLLFKGVRHAKSSGKADYSKDSQTYAGRQIHPRI
jgi:hypothetical protein